MQAATSIAYRSLYEQPQLKITALQQQLSQLQKMIFGSRHEKFIASDADPSQLSLDIQAEATAICSVGDAKKITYTRKLMYQ